MKHATQEALVRLDDLLEQVRQLSGLKERTPGAFYAKGSGFLHFHEDPAGFFADLKERGDWVRYPVNTKTEKKRLIERARTVLAG
jgi:hypothetical protein